MFYFICIIIILTFNILLLFLEGKEYLIFQMISSWVSTSSTGLNDHDLWLSIQGLYLTKVSDEQFSVPDFTSVLVQQVAKLITMANDSQQETIAVHMIVFVCDPFFWGLLIS